MGGRRRPHEAPGLEAPASRYRPRLRAFPETLPLIEYPASIQVRRVQQGGEVSFEGRVVQISRAFRGCPVGLRPTDEDGVFEVLFGYFVVGRVRLKEKG